MPRQVKLVQPATTNFLLHSTRELTTPLKVRRELRIRQVHDTVVEAGCLILLDFDTHHPRSELQHYVN
jgi:hypothetical protein